MMTQQHQENAFETELCEHLAAHGWLYSADGTGYDRQRALFPEDVFAWLQETQPEELARKVKPGMTEAAKAKARDGILDRLGKLLDQGRPTGGSLQVLRSGFKDTPAAFQMMQKRPETMINQTVVERYEANRLRVMRQVHYSVKHANSIDLVLFVNGIPVATLELKTDFTQTVDDAKAQYRDDRQPAGEPLLGFGTRALVHFAVSNDEVWMTTKLAGAATRFLPFNRGDDGHAGNPLDEAGGSSTTYLWRDVLQRDSWLDILGRFVHYETEKVKDHHGRAVRRHNLIFPRFHQLDAVTGIVADAQENGPGHNYLVQHSAGSGKTRSIAWTAHRLATLHDETDGKVFDTVIVVTDRTVLDDQLQEAIKQLEARSGIVQTIDLRAVRRMHVDPNIEKRSKSTLLSKALSSGKLIIVVTLQTFPHVLDALKNDPKMRGKKFAIIADEAHSSMSSGTSKELREALAHLVEPDGEALPDEGDIDQVVDVGDMLASVPSAVNTPNVSFLAFTATPKAKTMELFGREQPDGSYLPFHTYSMAQAIEEGFILDVLANYLSYSTAFQLAQKAKAGEIHAPRVDEDEDLVDESAATKGLVKWVRLHPTNISQKVAVIVEHFEANVKHWLGGKAKAMVVTDSRLAAVRYKKAMDDYIIKKGYGDVTRLIAFSGEVEVKAEDLEGYPSIPGVAAGDRFTESSMNAGDTRDLRAAFDTREYRVMIVADKFQTGFDQPKLCAMYVDKKLDGIAAVQTLSRLNRAVPGKKTVVLDFINKPDQILAAFKDYYQEAMLQEATDPNLVHDLMTKLDQSGYYSMDEVDSVVEAFLKNKGNNALSGALGPVLQRYKAAWHTAGNAHDKAGIDELDTFRKDVSSFLKLYDFLSQVVDFDDTDVEKRAIFLRLLAMRLGRPGSAPTAVDLTDVQLVKVMQVESGKQALDLETGEARVLKPTTALGSRPVRDPHLILLDEIIARLNEQFAGENFRDEQVATWAESLVAAMKVDDELQAQATASTEDQFLASPTLRDALLLAVAETHDAHARMTDLFNEKGAVEQAVLELLGRLVYLELHGPDSEIVNRTPAG